MALYLFTSAILNNQKINVFNKGNLFRDFTFIDDVITGIEKIIFSKKQTENLHEVYNIGRGYSVKLLDFIIEIERNLNKKSKKKFIGHAKWVMFSKHILI